jgi:ribosomal protein S18 acetylase RimI-like enzyme
LGREWVKPFLHQKMEKVIDSTAMKIRTRRKADTAVLRQIHQRISPDQPYPAMHHVWLVEVGGQVVGYTAVSSIPGLPNVYNLDGGILPTYRRQGLGSQLLQHVLREAEALRIHQLSHCVTDPDSVGAHFLRHHNFFIEHEEWLMVLPNLQTRQFADSPPATCKLATRHSPTHLFCQIYDQSFGDTPWYQPYSQEEAENTLECPDDILFLFKDKQPIGFAWLQGEAIEPIGVVREEWGKGYGRALLLAALHKLKQRGAVQAKIGVWRDNRAAVRLYESVGFQHQQTLTYLAYELEVDLSS